MSGPRHLIDTTWQLVWALLVCAVVFSFLRQRAVDGLPAVTSDHPIGMGQAWIGLLLGRLCTALFVIGIVARLKRWLSAQTAESARKRRIEAAQTLVGAPERFGVRAPNHRVVRNRRGRH